MSIQAMVWVLDHSESTLADRLVLLAIANHCDALGRNAWPSIDHIAAEARVHPATASRAVAALEALGELTVDRRVGRSSRYAITALKGSQIAGGRGVADCGGPPASDASTPRKLRPKPLRTVKEPSSAGAHAREREDEEPRSRVPYWTNDMAPLTPEERAAGLAAVRAIRRPS